MVQVGVMSLGVFFCFMSLFFGPLAFFFGVLVVGFSFSVTEYGFSMMPLIISILIIVGVYFFLLSVVAPSEVIETQYECSGAGNGIQTTYDAIQSCDTRCNKFSTEITCRENKVYCICD